MPTGKIHSIKTPSEWTHAIKTRSPYMSIKTPISTELTPIKTPSEPTRSPSADQNPIWTHPKSKPTSPRITSHIPHTLRWTPCKTAQATLNCNPLRQHFLTRIKLELSNICDEILKLLDTRLIPSAATDDSKVFYLKHQHKERETREVREREEDEILRDAEKEIFDIEEREKIKGLKYIISVWHSARVPSYL